MALAGPSLTYWRAWRLPELELVSNRAVRSRYSSLVHEHFTNPRNVGAFDQNDARIGTAVVGKAACGDVIKLQVQIEKNVIQDVRFKAFGCGSAIASSSFASEMIKGMTVDDALKLKNSDIADSLALPPVKIHCSLLAEDAIKLAIKNYQDRLSATPTVEGPRK